MSSEITIIGSGHGGCAAAAALSMKGFNVRVCKAGRSMHMENFSKIRQNNGIFLKGIEGEGFAKLYKITTDVKEAIEDVEIILIFYVTTFHEFLASKIAPYLKSGQIVFINPGYAGSLLFKKAMEDCNNQADVLFVEGETLPYTSRIIEPGTVEITSRNVRHPVAALPSNRTSEAIQKLSVVFPDGIPRKNILEVALHNPNLVIHTVGTIMNIGRIEYSKGEFYMYREGFTESMWNIVEELDKEKMAIIEKIGGEPISYFDEFRLRTFKDTSVDPFEGFMRYADESPKGPANSKSRYITEDVPIGLGLLSSLGKMLQIPTPICDSLIALASAINKTDYFKHARTVEKLGIKNISDIRRL
jgi:opine dehydrogenase